MSATQFMSPAQSINRPKNPASVDSGGTVSTNVTYTQAKRAIYVGAAGDVVLTHAGGDVTYPNLAAGVWHAFPDFTGIKSTGTTAQDVVVGE